MRAFVVGNGPSLAHTNLENMNGEVSFAVNNIHLIYASTSWRPTHYVRAEQAFGLEPEHWLESMRVHLGLDCNIWCNDYFFRPRFGISPSLKTRYLKACAHYAKHFNNPDCPHLWHLPRLCTFGSSVNVAIQLAFQQGYSPIYLLGCDLGYEDGKPSHFDPNYEHGQEQEARYANMDTLAAHMVASRSGAEIYNATIGGSLEAYPRMEFESLFQ